MRVFHVELKIKTLLKGFLVFLAMAVFTSCIRPQRTVSIDDYVLLENGMEIVGKEKGLTAFMFENNPRKIAFQQFIVDKYNLGSYDDVTYQVDVDGYRFKVYLYENADIEKYFNTSQFMVTMAETEANIKGSTAKFIALSVVNNANEDCLAEDSLFQQIAIKYLKSLKDEYYSL